MNSWLIIERPSTSTKFLVGRDGQVLARFAPPTDPEADELVAEIEKSL